MAQNIITILTEGDHDAAFIYRILKADGFTTYSNLIKDFPSPLDKILAHDVLEVSIPEVNIQVAKSRFLPSNVLTDAAGNMMLIYSLGGESRSDKRTKLIDTFNALNTSNPNELQVVAGANIAFLYFLDADDVGINKRLTEINKEVASVFVEAVQEITANAEVTMVDDILIGAYIFAESGTDKGKLEDILLPIMQDGNNDIFEKATAFLGIHKSTNLYKDNLKFYDKEETMVKKVFDDKYHQKKSLIGTIGQLHKSGKSNTVCISDTQYLTDGKLKANGVCNDILAFIKKAIR